MLKLSYVAIRSCIAHCILVDYSTVICYDELICHLSGGSILSLFFFMESPVNKLCSPNQTPHDVAPDLIGVGRGGARGGQAPQ